MSKRWTNPLDPDVRLLSKLGSIIVHTEEFFSMQGHEFDLEALKALLAEPDVRQWIEAMTKAALLPLKRPRPSAGPSP